MLVFSPLSPQYCNGGDLADYLQGKHQANLSATATSTPSPTHSLTHSQRVLFIKTKQLVRYTMTEGVCVRFLVCVCGCAFMLEENVVCRSSSLTQ